MTKPETLLKAAEIAIPELRWYLQENDRVYSMREDDQEPQEFDPHNNPADQLALWKGLAEEYITIGKGYWSYDESPQKDWWYWDNNITDGFGNEFKTWLDAALAAVEALEDL